MPRAKTSFGKRPTLGFAPAALSEAEQLVLADICPDPRFAGAVADLAGEYRARVRHEAELPTAAEILANLRAIEARADSLRKEAHALLEILGGLDERTGASLAAEPATYEWLADPAMARLASAARRVIESADDDATRRKESVARRRAGEAVKTLCQEFRVPYSKTAGREVSEDSAAIRVLRIVLGIPNGRIEDALP